MNNGKQIQANNGLIYTLDFDGVICDSAIETSITGWKAAQKIWQDMPNRPPSKVLIDYFRQVRPFLETGYEAILIMRLLQQETPVASLCDNYTALLKTLIDKENLNTSALKKLFGETRDHWIQEDIQEWLKMNPLFKGIQLALNCLENTTWYIITTKQERFVQQILQANNILLKNKYIYGMERQMSKAETLLELEKKHPNQSIVFVEDRFPTLVNINTHQSLQRIKLQLALWGYNTSADKKKAQSLPIELINIKQFLSPK